MKMDEHEELQSGNAERYDINMRDKIMYIPGGEKARHL